ncbi:hypothetical protein [Anaerocolumna jejuensis]|uniref:hypothetical protein n=1 Tax=Anaerocolumna jejuensis TaxID=259063 RepID=UPI003F7C3F50
MKIRNILFILIILSILSYGYQKSNNNSINIDTKDLATVSYPVTSPSGKYQLVIKEEIVDGTKHNKFDIFKISDGKPGTSAIFSSKVLFRTRDTLYFLWGDNDSVWVYSGDLGTFFWERAADKTWKKHDYTEDNKVPVPALLKKLKPEYFNDN